MNLSKVAAMMREQDKLRIYLVSMLGIIDAESADDPDKKLSIYYHSPVFIEAQSLNMAVEVAKGRVNELWPKSDGWKLRSVAVEPVSPKSIELMLGYWQTGLMAREADPQEQGITINLDATDSQSQIIGEMNKPAS